MGSQGSGRSYSQHRCVILLVPSIVSHTYCTSLPSKGASPTNSITIRRRFQFSSALKRMATVSTLGVGGKSLFSVKGAPEVIKGMLAVVPEGYDDTYKWFTRRGSRVLALAMKEVAPIGLDKVSTDCLCVC